MSILIPKTKSSTKAFGEYSRLNGFPAVIVSITCFLPSTVLAASNFKRRDLRSVEQAISTSLLLSSIVFLSTLDAIAAIVIGGSCAFVIFAAAVIAAVADDGCAFTALIPPLIPTGFAVVASIGSCDDGHVFVVFAAAIVAAVADVETRDLNAIPLIFASLSSSSGVVNVEVGGFAVLLFAFDGVVV